MKIHKDFEIRELIADLQKKPEKHLALDIDQKADILEYIQNEIIKHTKEAFEIIDLNPNYPYPAAVTDKVEYWINASLSHLLYIQKLLKQPPAKDPFFTNESIKLRETDFWTVFNNLELENFSTENEIDLWPLFNSLISKIEEAVLKDSEAGLIFINRNLVNISGSYEYLQHLRSINPTKGEFAGLQSVLQSLSDSLLLMLKDYYPDTLNEYNILSFAEKYCSIQIFEGITQSKIDPPEIKETTQDKIREIFNTYYEDWTEVFKSKMDFDQLVESLTHYFEEMPPNLKQINTKPRTKVKLGKFLGEVFNELAKPNETKKGNKVFEAIVRQIDQFEKIPEKNLYDYITRN